MNKICVSLQCTLPTFLHTQASASAAPRSCPHSAPLAAIRGVLQLQEVGHADPGGPLEAGGAGKGGGEKWQNATLAGMRRGTMGGGSHTHTCLDSFPAGRAAAAGSGVAVDPRPRICCLSVG